jgi:hypothetical protein
MTATRSQPSGALQSLNNSSTTSRRRLLFRFSFASLYPVAASLGVVCWVYGRAGQRWVLQKIGIASLGNIQGRTHPKCMTGGESDGRASKISIFQRIWGTKVGTHPKCTISVVSDGRAGNKPAAGGMWYMARRDSAGRDPSLGHLCQGCSQLPPSSNASIPGPSSTCASTCTACTSSSFKLGN